MLCKCHWIVLYMVHFTAFCLGGRLFPGHGVCNICHLCTFTENYERNGCQFRAYNGVDCFAAAAIRHARYTIQQEAKLLLG